MLFAMIVHNKIVKGAFKNITNHSLANSIVFVTITKIVIPFESNWILSTSIVAHIIIIIIIIIFFVSNYLESIRFLRSFSSSI